VEVVVAVPACAVILILIAKSDARDETSIRSVVFEVVVVLAREPDQQCSLHRIYSLGLGLVVLELSGNKSKPCRSRYLFAKLQYTDK
jgi:hypothetical protein